MPASDVLEEGAPRLRQVAQMATLRIFAESLPVFLRQLEQDVNSFYFLVLFFA